LLLAIILLDIPLQIDINLDYQAGPAALGALGGWNVSVTTLCLIGLYALWTIQLLSKANIHLRPSLRASVPIVLYLAFDALSILSAYDVKLALFEIFLLVQLFMLYVYIVSTVRTQEDLLFIIIMLLLGLILESLIMMLVYITRHDLQFAVLSTKVDQSFYRAQVIRVGGTLRSPSAASIYISLLLAPTASILLSRLGRWYKRIAMVAFGLGGIALALTFTRGGWIAFGISITILCLLAWRRGWLALSIPLSTAIVVGILIFLFRDAFLARLAEGENGRIPLIQLAFYVINDHPLLGIGANNFAIAINQYATPEFDRSWLYIVHNKYLLVWAEAGIGGLIAFIWFLTATVYRGWRCWNANHQFLSIISLGFMAAIIGHMVHMNFDLFSGRPQVQLLWVIVGLTIAVDRMQGKN